MTVRVCIGSACHLQGSFDVISGLQRCVRENGLDRRVEILAVFCMGCCAGPVSVRVGEDAVESVRPAGVEAFFARRVLPALSARKEA